MELVRARGGEFKGYLSGGGAGGKKAPVMLPYRGKARGVFGLRLVGAAAFLRDHTEVKLGKGGKGSSVRVRRNGLKAALARRSELRRAGRERMKHVGRLAAGWLAGVRVSGLKKVPKWIGRHEGYASGEASLKVERGKVVFKMRHGMRNVADGGVIERAAKGAAAAGERNMKQVAVMMMKKAIRETRRREIRGCG